MCKYTASAGQLSSSCCMGYFCQMTPMPLPPHYLPSVHWWAQAVQQAGPSERVLWLSTQVQYEKQTPLSRTQIKTCNGVQTLVIPVRHHSRHQPLALAQPEDAQRWRQVHSRALQSAYGRCAYWEHYGPPLLATLAQADTLWALNEGLIQQMATALGLGVQAVAAPPAAIGCYVLPLYFQPFDAHVPGLSGLDLLMNTGPEALRLLLQARAG